MSGAILEIIGNFIYSYLPYLVLFFAALYMPADTDLGWHLKYGEYFFKTGKILRDNIFSLDMSTYKWANSSWLTDIITFSIYKYGGFLGLSIAGALTVVLIFFVLNKALKLSFYEKSFIFPILFFLEEPLLQVSFRGQLLSLLFSAVIIYIISEFKRGNKKSFWYAIPVFLVWGNLHGGFLLGMVILAFYFFLKLCSGLYLKKRNEFRNDLKYLPALGLSMIAPIINPFGISVYSEVLKHFGNPYQKYILEWLPLPPFTDLWWLLIFWGIFMIFSVRMLIDKDKFSDYSEWIIITTILFFAAFWMRRYAWSMYLFSIPISVFFFREIKPTRGSLLSKVLPVLILSSVYLYSIFYHIPQQKLNHMNWSRFCTDFISCSPESAEFLKTNRFNGRFLSNYNWGGWLIWNYPEVKPSIDGRMHLWRDDKGYSAFAKYYFLEQNINDIDKSDYDSVYMSSQKPLFNRMLELVQQGKWIAVYQDKLAGVFVRVKK